MINIQKNRLYVNNTLKYIVPTLKEYNGELLTILNKLPKLAVGYYDELISDKLKLNNHLFFLIDTKFGKTSSTINELITKLIDLDYVDYNYVFDDIVSGFSHMFVISIPEKYHNAFENFKKGKYSKMYTKDELEFLFPKFDKRLNIFNRTVDSLYSFKARIEKEFNVKLDNNKLKDFEADYPPIKENEIFNYGFKRHGS